MKCVKCNEEHITDELYIVVDNEDDVVCDKCFEQHCEIIDDEVKYKMSDVERDILLEVMRRYK